VFGMAAVLCDGVAKEVGVVRTNVLLTASQDSVAPPVRHDEGVLYSRTMTEVQPPSDSAAPGSALSVRAGDGDREAVADRLRVAAGEGRIELAELEDRLERAYRAKTYGELDELVADLPRGRSSPTGPDTLQGPETLVLDTTETKINLKQNGRWIVPRRIVARCTRSLITIDFTEASCAHREVTVEASCGTGWITMIVPRGWAVTVDATSTNTANVHNKATAPVDPHAPTLNVIAHPQHGYVRIKQRR
jgi:hypothetical protein